jgi:hypothetical protein
MNEFTLCIHGLSREPGALDLVQEALSYLLHGDAAPSCDHSRIVLSFPDYGHAWRRWLEPGDPLALRFREQRLTARIAIFCQTCGICSDLNGVELTPPAMGGRVGKPPRMRWLLRFIERYTNHELCEQLYVYLAHEVFYRVLHRSSVPAPSAIEKPAGLLRQFQESGQGHKCKYSTAILMVPSLGWSVSAANGGRGIDPGVRAIGSVKKPDDILLVCGACHRTITLSRENIDLHASLQQDGLGGSRDKPELARVS